MRATLAVFTALLVLAGACAPAATPSSSPAQVSTAPTGTVTVALSTFNKDVVDKSLDLNAALTYLAPMYDFFVGATPDGKLSFANGVLESAQTTDAKVYTLKLRSGIKWHDGTAMTSEDIKFSVDWQMRAAAACAACSLLKAEVATLDIVDPLTVRATLKVADVAFVNALGPIEGDLVVLPKAYMDKVGATGFAATPMGSGPFKFVSHAAGVSFEYAANTDYWNKSRVPSIAKLRILNSPEERTRDAQVRTGEADLVQSSPNGSAALEKAGFKVVGPKNVAQLVLNYTGSYDPAQLSNKLEFRKAIAMAADYQAIGKVFYPTGGETGGSAFFSPLTIAYDATLKPYPFDPTQAKALLAQAGYKGEKVTLYNGPAGGDDITGLMEAVASAWKQVGITVEIVTLDAAGNTARIVREPQVYPAGASLSITNSSTKPSILGNIRTFMISRKLGGTSLLYWNQAKIDAAYQQVSSITDDQQRTQQLLALSRELYAEYWGIPVAMRDSKYVAGPKLADWQPPSGQLADLGFNTLKLKP